MGQAAEMKYLRKVMGVTRLVRKQLNMLMWFGHMCRMDPSRQVRAISEAQINIKKGKSRPRETWNDAMVDMLRKRGLMSGNPCTRREEGDKGYIYIILTTYS